MSEHDLPRWRQAWRLGVLPELPTRGLEALADALRDADPAVLRGRTARPGPGDGEGHWQRPCEAACPIGFALWRGLGLARVEEVQAAFREACARANSRLRRAEAADGLSVEDLIAAVDDEGHVHRAPLWAGLLEECAAELARRAEAARAA